MVDGFKRFFEERLIHFNKMIPLSLTFFFYLFGWGLLTPIFNIRINELTGSLFLSGIVFSIVGLIKMFIDPSMGLICDKLNPKRVLQWTLLLYCIIFLLYTVATTFTQLILVRLLHGFAAAMLWISGLTLVRLKSKGRHAQEEISAWVAFQNISYIIAPIIGGFIITILNWSIVFYLASLFSFIALIYATKKVESPKRSPSKRQGLKQQWRSFFKNKSSAVRLTILSFITVLIYSAFAAFLPIQLSFNGLSIEEIGIVLSIASTTPYILFPVIIGVISDKYGRKIPTLIGLLLAAFGFYNFSTINSFTQFFFYTFVVYTGAAFVSMSYDAELNDLMPKHEAGGFTGLFEMIKDAGFGLGPLIAGWLSTIMSINYTFFILSAVSLATILVLKGFKDY